MNVASTCTGLVMATLSWSPSQSMKDMQRSNAEGFLFHGDSNAVLPVLVEHSLIILPLCVASREGGSYAIGC